MKKIIGYFLQGLLYVVPVSATVYIFIAAISYTDGLIRDIDFIRDYTFPGMGLIVIISLVTTAGFFGPRLINTSLAQTMHKMMNSAPLIRLVYTSIKDLMSAFVGKERKFGTPVIVNLDDTGTVHRLGFITSENLEHINIEGLIGVYLPNSYGVLGDLVLVPSNKIKKIDAPSTDIMKFIVSGGITKLENEADTHHEQ